ncbi:hypothetical protein VN97_g12991, partial [Penicillium thymicola]
MRLAFFFLSITWLALAGLSSATVRFAVILRDRAKSDLATSGDSILDITFQNLMDNIIVGMVIVALISALLSIFGIALAIHPRCLREDRKYRLYYVCTQLVIGLIVLSLGGYVASKVHGFQTSFELFRSLCLSCLLPYAPYADTSRVRTRTYKWRSFIGVASRDARTEPTGL